MNAKTHELCMLITSQKHLFEIPETHAYLNTAYMSPLMHSVVAAMQEGIAYKVSPWTYKPETFFHPAEKVRHTAAQLFNAPADHIAIIPSVSYGIQIAANNLPLKKGQQIILLEAQFPSNVLAWHHKANISGGEIITIPTPDDHDWTRAVCAHINERTAIIALPHTHWTSGATLDLDVISQYVRAHSAALVLDVTQSLGAQPFNMQTIQPDFVVCATYKWLLGPYSLGFLYVAPKWHQGEPLEQSWINRCGSKDFTRLANYNHHYLSGALRFDMGEKSNPAQLMGAQAALAQILDWGVENIAKTLQHKTRTIANELAQYGLNPIPATYRAPHYLGVNFPSHVDVNQILDKLTQAHIYVSIRGQTMRITPHCYTSEADIERFLGTLHTLL